MSAHLQAVKDPTWEGFFPNPTPSLWTLWRGCVLDLVLLWFGFVSQGLLVIVLAENIPGGTGLRSQEFSIDLANSGPTLERRTLLDKCETLLLGPGK